MKVLIVLLLLVIIASLGFALNFLYKDRGQAGSNRTVKTLTARIGLSLGLFFLLILLYKLGVIHPHGLKSDYVAQPQSQTPAEIR